MPAIPFSADPHLDAAAATIALHGDVTLEAETGLADAYARVAAARATVLLLDFSDVGYINSTGIAVIVGLLANARRDGRQIRACGLSEHYAEIFRITRLSDYMPIFDDAASAIAATSPAGGAANPASPATAGG